MFGFLFGLTHLGFLVFFFNKNIFSGLLVAANPSQLPKWKVIGRGSFERGFLAFALEEYIF